ncbi:MAG: helix-turn-helix transcriptional regulator [Clostridia bacterium]|nr:helix-turn-helix transcriptional regulator [Clostridia bacterium]
MIKEQVGNRIKELRKRLGLSQEEFAFKCEMDRTYITSLERGKRNVSLENLDKIAKAFDMSLSEFFDFDN